MPMSVRVPRWTRWLKTVQEEGKLSQILKEIKESDPREVGMFLSGVIDLSRGSANIFYGDHTRLESELSSILPEGTVDIRDVDHDQDEIYHVFYGGFHCFLVEVLVHAAVVLPVNKSVSLLQNFWDYFFDKRRGCTSCVRRVLMLMPGDMRSEFLFDQVAKRREAYLGRVQHSIACMEMSLWLVLMAPLSEEARASLVRLITGCRDGYTKYLITYSHQHSVRQCLTKLLAS